MVEAFDNRGLPIWGLFDKRNFLTAGDSRESLDSFLERLEPGGSSTVYTLKVFKDIEDLDEITDRTECNGSFNFKLLNQHAGRGSDSELAARLGAIEKKLNGGDQEQEETLQDIVMGWLKEPQKLATVIGSVKSLFNGDPGPALQQMAAIGNVNPAPQQTLKAVNEMDPIERLSAAIDKLEKQDPKIIEHLEKLAEMSEKNPAMFKMLISNLDAL